MSERKIMRFIALRFNFNFKACPCQNYIIAGMLFGNKNVFRKFYDCDCCLADGCPVCAKHDKQLFRRYVRHKKHNVDWEWHCGFDCTVFTRTLSRGINISYKLYILPATNYRYLRHGQTKVTYAGQHQTGSLD